MLSAIASNEAGKTIANAYSGAGGHASGGSVGKDSKPNTGLGGLVSNLKLLDIGSNNAGAAGKAESGPVMSPAVGLANITNGDGSSGANSAANNVVGNAYSGVGGGANGGDVKEPDSAAISLFSGNAGKGGFGNSGGASSVGGLLGEGLPLPLSSAGRKTRSARMIRVRRTFAEASSDDI